MTSENQLYIDARRWLINGGQKMSALAAISQCLRIISEAEGLDRYIVELDRNGAHYFLVTIWKDQDAYQRLGDNRKFLEALQWVKNTGTRNSHSSWWGKEGIDIDMEEVKKMFKEKDHPKA